MLLISSSVFFNGFGVLSGELYPLLGGTYRFGNTQQLLPYLQV